MLYGSSGPSFPFTVNFPAFSNPFVANSVTTITIPAANGTITAHESVTGCPAAAYWQCLRDNDGNTSFVTINGTWDGIVNQGNPFNVGGYVNIHLQNLTGGNITSIVLTVWCRATGGTPRFENFHTDGGVTRPIVLACPQGSDFRPVTMRITNLPTLWPLDQYNIADTGVSEIANETGKIDITYMEAAVTQDTGPYTDCGAGNFFTNTACQIARFFYPLVLAIGTIIGVLLYIGAWIITFASIIGNVFVAIAWFFAVPGMPTFLQYLIDAVVIGVVIILIVSVVRVVRGSGP